MDSFSNPLTKNSASTSSEISTARTKAEYQRRVQAERIPVQDKGVECTCSGSEKKTFDKRVDSLVLIKDSRVLHLALESMAQVL